jgi:SAM-dependent methyltransferase
MSKKPSKDYHDYFIKDGRFVGRFEEMYQYADDPWHIDALGRRLDMDAALLLLRHSRERFGKILDLGCGQGLFTNLLLDLNPDQVWACDISATAVARAQSRYGDPRLRFFPFDLNQIAQLPVPEKHFDLVVMSQTIWCVLPKLQDILRACLKFMSESGSLLISQHFLQPGQQKYGSEIMTQPADLIAILESLGYVIKDTLETNRHTNHHLALWAKPGHGICKEEQHAGA